MRVGGDYTLIRYRQRALYLLQSLITVLQTILYKDFVLVHGLPLPLLELLVYRNIEFLV